ncbi:MAG TPA: hypothetical protein VNL14_22525 [Candidatus Acidoferrales bacterium]|nr:hypothetical protein [Candidatus Acidoferrales bacterium]
MRDLNIRSVASVLMFFLLPLSSAAGQAIWEPVVAGQPIPKNYQSWSVFLICNPQWYLAESGQRLQTLHEHFRSFGRAIGARHVAVWFWRSAPAAGGSFGPDNIDADRNAAFCEKFKLAPSASPYVVVTTSYPDLKAQELAREVVIELNNLPPADVGNLLTRLADQLLAQKLAQEEFDSAQYWSAWRRSFESVRDVVAGFVQKVKLTIDTKFVKLEIEGGAK